jgi:PAS domain S-box-containing protein
MAEVAGAISNQNLAPSAPAAPTPSTHAPAASLIFGTGEIADLIRASDWTQNPLGPIPTWPPLLITTINTLLASRHPLLLWWGPELIQFYNDAYRPSLGKIKHPRALGQRGKDCWYEVWDHIGPQIQSVLHNGVSTWNQNQHLPVYRNDDSLEDAWWTYSYSPLRDVDGHICGVFVVVSETTSAILAERERARSEERLQLALESAELGIWSYDPHDQTFTADDNMLRIFGSPKPTGDHAFWQTQLHPEDRRLAADAFADALAGHSSYDVEYRVLHPHGIRWIRSKGKVVLDANQARAMFAVVEDITERKRTETALRDSEERLRLALSAAREMGIFDWDIPRDHAVADERFCKLYGIDPKRGRTGIPMADALVNIHPDDYDEVCRRAQHSLDTGEDFTMDYRVYSTPESLRWVTARGACVKAHDGNPLRFIGAVLDITERKLAEAALLQNEKLAAVGRLASSIAHEINNPLESVTNLLYLAKTAAVSPQALSYLTLAETELRRASDITNLTLRFHKQSSRPTLVTCDDLIGSALGLHQSRLRNAEIRCERRKRAQQPVLCFDGEIRQVLNNLVSNAIDAMSPSGGRLLLRSREGHHWPTRRLGMILTVADTGPGISPHTLPRIFEPFYTTKGIAGTGLGLWVSKEILDRHDGHLAVRSSQHPSHQGTVFSLFLPYDAATR